MGTDSLADLVKVTTATTGTGTISLGSAVTGFRGTPALTDGRVYSYAIFGAGGAYEAGYGLYTSSGATLTRNVAESSNSNAAITLAGGETVVVGIVLQADILPVIGLGNEVVTPTYAPSTGVKLLARKSAGRAVLASQGAIGRPKDYMPHLGSEGFAYFTAADNAATWGSFGLFNGNPTTSGTLTAASQANTNAFTTQKRSKMVSPASTNSAAVFFYQTHVFRGSVAGAGGFDLRMRGGVETYQSGMRWAMGVASGSISSGDPSSWPNFMGLGKDAGDSNLQFMSVTSSGFTATKVDLGSNMPANTGGVDFYELRLFALPNDTSVYWSVERVNTGDFAQGQMTTNLGDPTSALGFAWYANTGAGSSSVAIAFVGATLFFGGTN